MGFSWHVLLLVLALINNWMVGQVQIRVDRENWQLVEYLRHIPGNSRVLFNTDYNEYVNETRLFLNEIMKRPDISVDIMDYELPYQNLDQKTFIVIPIHNHQLFPAVRIAVNELEAQTWKTCFDGFQNGQAELVQSNSSELWRPDFGFNRLMPRLGFRDLISAYQEKQYPFFYTSKLKYGWQVYRLSYDPDLLALPGSFRDGIWTFFEPSGALGSSIWAGRRCSICGGLGR